MRRDVQEIFKMTPHDKQVMMFSATLSKEIRPICKKFMQDVIFFNLILQIYNLPLFGQHYLMFCDFSCLWELVVVEARAF